MANSNYFCSFDFETGGKNPHTCVPLSLGAVMLDPRKLEICGEFYRLIKPEEHEYALIEPEALEITKINLDEVREKGLPKKLVWEEFVAFLNSYNSSKKIFTAPVRVGHNIINYDDHIVKRLCKDSGHLDGDGKPKIFHPRDVIDTLQLALLWFEGTNELPNYQLGTICKYFGLSLGDMHNSLVDSKCVAYIVSRFLKFHRNLSKTTQFKDSMKNVKL